MWLDSVAIGRWKRFDHPGGVFFLHAGGIHFATSNNDMYDLVGVRGMQRAPDTTTMLGSQILSSWSSRVLNYSRAPHQSLPRYSCHARNNVEASASHVVSPAAKRSQSEERSPTCKRHATQSEVKKSPAKIERIDRIKPEWFHFISGRIEVGWKFNGTSSVPPAVLWCKGTVIRAMCSKNTSKLHSVKSSKITSGGSSVLVEVDFDEIPHISKRTTCSFEAHLGKWDATTVPKHWHWRLLTGDNVATKGGGEVTSKRVPSWHSELIGKRIEVGWLYKGDKIWRETVEWCRGNIISIALCGKCRGSHGKKRRLLCNVNFDDGGPSLFEIDIGNWSKRRTPKHWEWRLLLA